MKKKIKDLTKKQLEKFCLKHAKCRECPFWKYGELCDYINDKLEISNKEIDL